MATKKNTVKKSQSQYSTIVLLLTGAFVALSITFAMLAGLNSL